MNKVLFWMVIVWVAVSWCLYLLIKNLMYGKTFNASETRSENQEKATQN